MTHHPDDNPPEGFVPTPQVAAPELYAGPYYERRVETGYQLGFRVADRHLNVAGDCHGGVLATFADLQGYPIKKALNLAVVSPTISLSLDYVAPVKLGAWVQTEPQLVRRTKRLLFFASLITADGEVALRTNGIYRLTEVPFALSGIF